MRGALADYSTSLKSLEQSVKDSAAAFGSAPMSPFLGNHDVPRFLTEAAVMLDGDPSAQAWNDPPAAPADDAGYQKLMLALDLRRSPSRGCRSSITATSTACRARPIPTTGAS